MSRNIVLALGRDIWSTSVFRPVWVFNPFYAFSTGVCMLAYSGSAEVLLGLPWPLVNRPTSSRPTSSSLPNFSLCIALLGHRKLFSMTLWGLEFCWQFRSFCQDWPLRLFCSSISTWTKQTASLQGFLPGKWDKHPLYRCPPELIWGFYHFPLRGFALELGTEDSELSAHNL